MYKIHRMPTRIVYVFYKPITENVDVIEDQACLPLDDALEKPQLHVSGRRRIPRIQRIPHSGGRFAQLLFY